LSNRPILIALDEDGKTLREIEVAASGMFRVVATRSWEQALSLTRTDSTVAALLVNQTLSKTNGLTVLKAAQSIRPATQRVLMASPGHLSEVIDGLHCGAVSRIIYKPIRSAELLGALAPPAEARRATA
jgi:DNA-binding NtrC family response regulator